MTTRTASPRGREVDFAVPRKKVLPERWERDRRDRREDGREDG